MPANPDIHLYAQGCVVVFYGYLSNLAELARDMSTKLDAALLDHEMMQASTVGPLTAAVILQLYMEQRDGNELLLLSEIQVGGLVTFGSRWYL